MDIRDRGMLEKKMLRKKKGKVEGWGRKYTLVKSSGGHCCSAPASALLMKVLSLHRHLKSLDWQPVEPMAERAGLCCGRGSVSFDFLFFLSFLEGRNRLVGGERMAEPI